MTIDESLRAAVERSGLTAYAIAQASGVSQGVLSRWLSGKRDITLTTADKIAAAVGVKVHIKPPPAA